jgi:hypothetical protein
MPQLIYRLPILYYFCLGVDKHMAFGFTVQTHGATHFPPNLAE